MSEKTSSAGSDIALGMQEVRKCPCGVDDCKQWVVYPMFSNPNAALWDRAEAEEVVRRLNSFERAPSADGATP
jgi:hypothetical protein